jgi:hypothetical protein
MSFDDSNTFSFIFKGDDSVGKLSGFSPQYDLVMVENGFFEEHSPCGSDVNFCSVFDIRVENKLGLFSAEAKFYEISELFGLN